MSHRATRRNLLRAISTLGAAGVSGYLSDVLAAGDVRLELDVLAR